MAGFQGLTLTPIYATTDGQTFNTNLVTGLYVVGILDPVSGINRMYNPASVGYTPTGGDAASVWLPKVTAVTPISQVDAYWAPVFKDQSGATYTAKTKLGQVQVVLQAGTSDFVRGSSVMKFQLSANALLLTTVSTF